MRPKNLVEYIAGGNLPVKKGHRKGGDSQDVLVPQKPESNPADTAESSTAPADTKASVQDPASESSPLSLLRGKNSRNTKIKEHYGTCQCKGVHFEEKTLKSAMKKDSDNICACTCIACRARNSKRAKRTDDKTTEQSHRRTNRECLGQSISKQNKNKDRNANANQRQENDNRLSSEVQKLSKATSSEYRTYSSSFSAQISKSKEPTQHYSSQRSPVFVVVVMSRLLVPSRSEVVIREDVIECQSDPRPNAFFDSRVGVMRVYHGPNFGNPSATLAPLGNQRASPGPEIGDTFGGWADRTGNREPDSRWTAISGPQPGGRQGGAQFGPSGWSGGPWASGGRNDNPNNSQQGSGRNDVRIQSHNRNISNKNQRRPGNDNRGWNKSGFNSSESHNNAGNSTWNRNNSTTWDNNNDSSSDQVNNDGGNNGENWKNTHTSDNYNKFNNDGNAKNDSNSDHNYKEDYAGDSNNLPGAWPSDENEKNDDYDNNGGNGGDFNDDNNQKSGWNTPAEPPGWSNNFRDTSNDDNWGGDNSKFNNDNTDNFGDRKNSNDNSQNNNNNYRSSSKDQSNWNQSNQDDQSRNNRKQNNNNSGNNSFGNKAFDNNQSGSPCNRKKRMNQDQTRNWNPNDKLADSSWNANPAQTVLSNNSWDDSNAVGPTAAGGGGKGGASNRNDNRNRSGNTITSANRAPQGNNRNNNFSGNKNASNKGSNKGSGNFNGNDNSREDANNEWGPPTVQASWADPTVAADTSGWGSSAWK